MTGCHPTSEEQLRQLRKLPRIPSKGPKYCCLHLSASYIFFMPVNERIRLGGEATSAKEPQLGI